MPMKKIFTLCVGLTIALTSWAQGFVFQFQGKNLADGETVVIAAEEDLFGDLSCETNSATNPNDGLVLRTLGSMASSGSATLQITSNGLNPSSLQWCMGGACMTLGSQTSLTKRFSAGGVTLVQFDAVGITSEGLLTATLRATIGLESHQVNIVFVNGDYDSIGSPRASAARAATCYDLCGRPLQGRPSAGICIRTDGTSVRKIAVK